MDIIIFGGQSNMQGQTEQLSDERIVPGAFEYKWMKNRLEPLKNPVGENIRYDGTEGCPVTSEMDGAGLGLWLEEHCLGAACYGHTNLVPEFCRAYLKSKCSGADSEPAYSGADLGPAYSGSDSRTNKVNAGDNMDQPLNPNPQVVAVHAAKGSTRITEWLPGTRGYQLLVEKSKAAINLAQTAEHIYFVWLQGESDAIASVSRECYKEHLRTLLAGLKRDLGVERFGIIRVGCFTEDDRDWEIMNAQSEICKEEPDFVMLTEIAAELNKQPIYMNPECRGHYSAAGIEKLGAEAGKTLALAEIVSHLANSTRQSEVSIV